MPQSMKVHPGRQVEGRKRAQKLADKTGQPVSLLQPFYRQSSTRPFKQTMVWTTYDTVYPAKRNARGTGTGTWIVYFNDKKPASYGYLKTARQKAQENANATGRSVQIYASQGRQAYTVSPKRTTNPTRYGTSYFVSLGAAILYYKDYGEDKEDVQRKIREGEIHIGKPPLKPGDVLMTTDGGKRYMIQEANPKPRKTKDYWSIEGYYGHGWEEVTAEDTWKQARERLKEYRENEPGTSFRARSRREKVGQESNPIGTKLTKVRVRIGKRIVPGMARRKNGRVQVFVTPQVARRVNPEGIHKWTMASIRAANKAAGYHFFDAAAKRFFNSKIFPAVYQGPGGVYFISSEYMESPSDTKYTVRQFKPDTGNVSAVGGFNFISHKSNAVDQAKRLARG